MFLEYVDLTGGSHLLSFDMIVEIRQSERENFDYYSYTDIETGDGVIETMNLYMNMRNKLKEADLIC